MTIDRITHIDVIFRNVAPYSLRQIERDSLMWLRQKHSAGINLTDEEFETLKKIKLVYDKLQSTPTAAQAIKDREAVERKLNTVYNKIGR